MNKKKFMMTASITMVAGLTFGIAAPASADTANGYRLCVLPKYPALTINSSHAGNGTWVNYDTSATSPISFPGGMSVQYSPYNRAWWHINNGANGFWYTPLPGAGCIV